VSLLEYYTLMDSDDPTAALSVLAPDLQFLLALPGAEVRGTSREDFASYIASRNASSRVHNILKHHLDGDVEFVYGVVTERGLVTGAFLSMARLDGDGRVVRYHSSFDTQLHVVEPSLS
jgi:hypothetical protein